MRAATCRFFHSCRGRQPPTASSTIHRVLPALRPSILRRVQSPRPRAEPDVGPRSMPLELPAANSGVAAGRATGGREGAGPARLRRQDRIAFTADPAREPVAPRGGWHPGRLRRFPHYQLREVLNAGLSKAHRNNPSDCLWRSESLQAILHFLDVCTHSWPLARANPCRRSLSLSQDVNSGREIAPSPHAQLISVSVHFLRAQWICTARAHPFGQLSSK